MIIKHNMFTLLEHNHQQRKVEGWSLSRLQWKVEEESGRASQLQASAAWQLGEGVGRAWGSWGELSSYFQSHHQAAYHPWGEPAFQTFSVHQSIYRYLTVHIFWITELNITQNIICLSAVGTGWQITLLSKLR